MLKLFEKCPACGGAVVITEIRCPHCQLVMQGQFTPGPFSALSDDQFAFIRAFLRVRGNLSELEKVLGISYPTIRNKLDEVNTVLDKAEAAARADLDSRGPAAESFSSAAGPEPAGQSERAAILQQVSAGVLSAAEAVQLLRSLKGG
jgi:hypothetical protein